MGRIMRLLVIGTCLTALCAGILSCSKSGEPGYYVNKAARFEIKFPEDWGIYADPMNWVPAVEGESPPESANDDFSEYVAVDVEELASKIDIKDYFDQHRKALAEENRYYEEHETGEIKIGGKKWMYVVYDKEMPEAYWRILAYVTVNKGNGYVINCAAENRQFDRHLITMKAVAHSFRFR